MYYIKIVFAGYDPVDSFCISFQTFRALLWTPSSAETEQQANTLLKNSVLKRTTEEGCTVEAETSGSLYKSWPGADRPQTQFNYNDGLNSLAMHSLVLAPKLN